MCGRYSLKTRLREIARQFNLLLDLPDLEPAEDITPGRPIPAILINPAGQGALRLLKWGLVPPWARDIKIGNRLINARAETLAEKPAFRDALKYRRCLIPADGFYEWQQVPAGSGKPHKERRYITRADGNLMLFAGLWEHWQDPHGNELETCTIITTAASPELAHIHDRMPLLPTASDQAAWLDPKILGAALLPGILSRSRWEPVIAGLKPPMAKSDPSGPPRSKPPPSDATLPLFGNQDGSDNAPSSRDARNS